MTVIFDVGETPELIGRPDALAWARANGIDPNKTVHVEIDVIDCPLLRVTEFAVDDEGLPFLDDAGEGAVLAPPKEIPLRSWPDFQR